MSKPSSPARFARPLFVALLSLSVTGPLQADVANRTTNPLPAFPGAEGFGASATGGRGGRVIKVTTLRPNGPGSLQAALDARGPRIVVFDVSGVIDADLYIRHGNLTIAGQTAPGGGVTIRGRLYAEYRYGIDNLVIRHIRVRPRAFSRSEGNPSQYDGIQLSRCKHVMLDHVSVSFGVDETIDLYEAQHVTVQWSTIEQSATYDKHNYGLLSGPDGGSISVHHNLFAHHLNRNPAIATGPADVINNVAYNVRHGFIHHNPAKGPFRIIGNYYKRGPDSKLFPFYFDDENRGASGTLRYFLSDNHVDDPGNFVGRVDNPWARPPIHPSFQNPGLPIAYRAASDFQFKGIRKHGPYIPVTIESAARALQSVLSRAGAWPRDRVTATSVRETMERSGTWGARVPDNLFEGLHSSPPPLDTDNDGIPDDWESAAGLNPQDASDLHKRMPSGYAAIEQYLNEVAQEIVGR